MPLCQLENQKDKIFVSLQHFDKGRYQLDGRRLADGGGKKRGGFSALRDACWLPSPLAPRPKIKRS